MAELVEIKAQARARVGKGTARGARRQGQVPAVIYGEKQSPVSVNLPYAELWKVYQTGHFFQNLLNIDLDGKKTRVIPRDVQVDPVMDTLVHVDFFRVSKGAEIRVAIPVEFMNQDKSPGIKRGGVLNIVRHEVELYVSAEDIPDKIVVNLDGLEIGASVHVSHVKLPAGTRPVIRRDFTIATIAGAMQERVETPAEGAAPAEGEAAAAGAATPAAGAAAPAAAPGAKGAAGAAPKAGAAAPAAAGAKPAAKPAAKK